MSWLRFLPREAGPTRPLNTDTRGVNSDSSGPWMPIHRHLPLPKAGAAGSQKRLVPSRLYQMAEMRGHTQYSAPLSRDQHRPGAVLGLQVGT